ncbi:MAG: hypothetical protein R3Y62_08345 [Eubacteriales bacterium]
MAERQKRMSGGYGANGSAAYDINRYGNAAPQLPVPELPLLPKERKVKPRIQVVKGKMAISPFAMISGVLCAVIMTLNIFGFVQLYEATTQVRNVETLLEAEMSTQESLLAEYESKIDLTTIESRATSELGLMQPTVGQTYQVNLSGEDRAVLIDISSGNTVTEVFGAIKTSMEALVAYLS